MFGWADYKFDVDRRRQVSDWSPICSFSMARPVRSYRSHDYPLFRGIFNKIVKDLFS